MDYNKKILLNFNRIYFLNIFLNKIIIENKYSIEYIYKYIKYYNKILKILNRFIINSKISFKDIKNIKNTYDCINEIIPPKELKIYEYKIINKLDNVKKKYEYIDGLDIIIYRKKTKTKDSLLFLIYQTSYTGLKKNRVYDISINLELLNYEFYIHIYNIFYNNNIYYTRGFLTYENNELYKMEKLYLLFKNNEIIKENLIYKYLYIYNFQTNKIKLNDDNIIQRLKYINDSDNYITYINDKDRYIYLKYKKKNIIDKDICNDKIHLCFNNIKLSIKKIFPNLYYQIDDYVYLFKNNEKYKIFTFKINETNSLNISIESMFINDYNIYITNSDFIKILIKFKMIDKSNKYMLDILNIDYMNESIENGFNKIINHNHIFHDTYIKIKTPYDILNSIYDLTNIKIDQHIFYNIENDEFYSKQNINNLYNIIKMYNSIYKFLNKIIY